MVTLQSLGRKKIIFFPIKSLPKMFSILRVKQKALTFEESVLAGDRFTARFPSHGQQSATREVMVVVAGVARSTTTRSTKETSEGRKKRRRARKEATTTTEEKRRQTTTRTRRRKRSLATRIGLLVASFFLANYHFAFQRMIQTYIQTYIHNSCCDSGAEPEVLLVDR